MPSTNFIKSIQLGLKYWRERTAVETEANILRLDDEKQNLYNIMTYAEKLPQLWPDTAVVALQAFYLVERRGYWRDWMPFMEKAVAVWVPDDPLLQAKLYNRLGYLYQVDRRLDAAVAAHEQAAQLAQTVGDDFVLHQAYFYLCADYRHKREYELAETFGQKALAGFSKDDEINKWWAFALNELGILMQHQGKFDLARLQYEAAVQIYQQLEEPTYLLRSYNNLIGLAREEKNPDLALHVYQEATRLIEHISGVFDKVQMDIALGGIYFDLEQYAEAEAIFRRANSLYLQQSSNVYQQALVLQCLGIAQLKQEKLAAAEESLCEGVRLWRKVDDEVMLGNTLGTLAELYQAQGERGKARELCVEALALFAKHPTSEMARRLTQEYQTFLKTL